MIRKLLDKYILVYIFCWLFIHICRQLHHPIPFLNNWLTDFIFLPMTFHMAKSVFYLLAKTETTFDFTLSALLIATAYVSIVLEYFAPKYSHKFTRDIMDVCMYFGGTIFYYFVHQKRKRSIFFKF